ncbi:MAG: hypothetical protein WCJ46_01040 [bacterium]
MAEEKKKKKPETADLRPATAEDIISGLKNRDLFINVPKTLLKKEEWGLLTVLSIILAGIFPVYFINILLVSFFTEVGHFWTTHLTENERKNLIDFEKEFRAGYEMEKAGKWDEAIAVYEKLIPKYKSNPKISAIATQRIDFIKNEKSGKGN